MVERSRSLGFWMVRGLGLLVGLAVLVAACGVVFQQIAENRDMAAFPAPGTYYDVGDVRLHMYCEGQGSQTLIFLSGMGNPVASFDPLARELHPYVRVCAYDRDGLGWSEDSGLPRDAGVASQRLARLLDVAEIEGPVMLLGHSYGALVARVFADRFPDRVSGLVLLDSSHEDMGERFPPFAQEGFRDLLTGFQLAALLNRFGLPRGVGLFEPAIDGLEGKDFDRSLAQLNSVSHMIATGEEARGWERSAVAARVARGHGFGDLPLDVFMVGGWPPEMMPSWTAMQRELADFSRRSRFHFLDAANHSQIGMDARYVPLVAAAVRARLSESASP